MANWTVPDAEVTYRFSTSGGPGGQHANRSNTKVDATFELDSSTMPAALRERVRAKVGDTIRVTVDEARSQLRNREIARSRIQARIDDAARVPRRRKATKATRASQRRRLDAKRRRGDVKRQRRRPRLDD